MPDEAMEAGLAQLRGSQALELTASQLGVRNLTGEPGADTAKVKDRVYASNTELWHALLHERLRATAVVRLNDFWLSEWFPLRPGLFHTEQGLRSRRYAQRYLLTGPGASPNAQREFRQLFGRDIAPEVIDRFQLESTYVYSPHGKTMMLDGGIGCIRLRPKQLSAGDVSFMGATSEPVAHQGIPVALPKHLYERFDDQLTEEGSIHCNLTGRLQYLPAEFDPLYRKLVGVPQVYILVDQLTRSSPAPDVMFSADGAVMVSAESAKRPPEGEWDLADGVFAAFVSFYPGMPDAVNIAARWLRDVYVGEVLNGQVLTDFDERIRRFDNAIFSLEHIMGARVSTDQIRHLLRKCAASPDDTEAFIERVIVVNNSRNFNISGSNNVVASEGGAAAGSGGTAAAGGSAAAGQNSTASVGQSAAVKRSDKRAKKYRLAKVSGIIAIIITALATMLVVLKATYIGIAGYVLAVVAVLVGVIPLFQSDK